MRLRADLVLLVVAALWGSAFAAQRAAGLLGSVYFFNAARFLLAGLLLIPFATRARFERGQLGWAAAAGTVLFVASALQQAGLRTTTAGNAGFLTSLYVVLVPFVLLLGWRLVPRPLSLLAALIAAFGAFLLSSSGTLPTQIGDLLELGGAVLWAVHVVILGKFASRYDAIPFSAIQLLVASALNWCATAMLETPTFPLPQALWISIFYTSIASLALGYTLQIWAQRHTPPTDAAIILSLESVFAAISGVIILAETLAGRQVLGCIVIVGAVLLSQLAAKSRSQVAAV